MNDLIIWAFLMLAGTSTHFLKQMVTKRRADGSPVGVVTYWSMYPYETLLSVVGALAIFIITWRLGMMNDAVAFSSGYMGNSAADIWGSRAKDIAGGSKQ